MPWNEQKAMDRVAENDFRNESIKVGDLHREMDLENLGPNDVRRADGAHIYVDAPNFHLAVADAGGDKQEQKKLVRAASVLRRVQVEIIEEAEVGKIQMQAARLHAFCYKPYDDEAKRAERAVCTAISLNSYVHDVFNDAFDTVRDFQTSSGIDAGAFLIANIGFRGERERISLGTCANVAAKIINGRDTLTITEAIYDLLPDCLQNQFEKSEKRAGVLTYQAKGLRWKDHPDLSEELGVKFNHEKWKRRTEEYRDALPLSEIDIEGAEVLIDVDLLSERKNKRTEAIVLYADLDGFTRYVREAEIDEDVESLVQIFKMIRREFHCVIEKEDNDGLVLQHQGDCVLGILHLPAGEDEKDCDRRRRKAVDIAIGLQSSMEHVLNQRLGDRKDVHVAVGLDVGQALVSRLGKKGKREVVCLGPAVDSAQRLQRKSNGSEIRIAEEIYDALDDDCLKTQFAKDGDTYLATDLTFPRLDRLRQEEAAKAGKLGATVTGDRVLVNTSGASQTKPWSATAR